LEQLRYEIFQTFGHVKRMYKIRMELFDYKLKSNDTKEEANGTSK